MNCPHCTKAIDDKIILAAAGSIRSAKRTVKRGGPKVKSYKCNRCESRIKGQTAYREHRRDCKRKEPS